ncbi:MAG: winged helix-turn-helix transcriptional regulator [Clostridiales bacterium]|nr:winged helix-turn-helix transcriptional regulator [Clostridiales bacterium]
MLEREFEKLYFKFRLNFLNNLFNGVKDGSLNPTDSYCLEVIFLLGRPTVNEFAERVNTSLPNASYRVNNLINKGYVKKTVSEHDRREYHLEVTKKFTDLYGANASFNTQLMNNIREKFSEKEIEQLEGFIKRIVDEIMD